MTLRDAVCAPSATYRASLRRAAPWRGLEAFRSPLYRVIEPLTAWLVRNRVHPNLLTTVGFVVTVVAGAFYAFDHVRTRARSCW